MKVAVLGVSHWHVPMYLEHLAGVEEAQVVAISDPSRESMQRVAHLAPDARQYTDYRALLDAEEVDLVFAHAPHDEMTQMARELVERGLAFHMEKPMGMDWRELDEVAQQAREKGLFVSVPLVSRHFGVVAKLLEMRQAGELGEALYYSFRLFAGPPHRYEEMGVGWMLEPERGGEGPLFNFGPHAIDLFLALTGAEAVRVHAWSSDALYGLAIPDIVAFMIEGDSGCYGMCEVSYTKSEGYERYMSLITTAVDYGGLPDVGKIVLRDGRSIQVDEPVFLDAYRIYVEEIVERVRAGGPLVGIEQMVRVLRVMNAVQRSLREGRPVEV